jgi:hypothetical protein
MPTLADKINTVRRRAGTTVDFLGQTGAFGLAGGVVGNHVDKDLGHKITQIQGVYDNFGPEAVTTLLATRAAQSAMRKLPGKARLALRTGARSVSKASPLIRGVLTLAESIIKRI